MQFIYKKAYNGMSKYPVRLQSGMDAKVVEGVGDKICRMLEVELHKYRESGSPSAQNIPKDDKSTPSQHNEPTAAPRRKRKGPMPAQTASVSDSESSLDSQEIPSGDRIDRPKKRKKKYMPAYRSGAYALLVSLYHEGKGEPGVYLTKSELISKAQAFSDTSMEVPPAGQVFGYTGWTSMSTLMKHQLVHRYGNPARFALTEDGVDLVTSLLEAEKKLQTGSSASTVDLDSCSPVNSGIECVSLADANPDVFSTVSTSNASSSGLDSLREPTDSNEATVFGFSYLDSACRPTSSKDNAMVDIFGNSVGYKIEFSQLKQSHPTALRVVNRTILENGLIQGYLLDEDAPETAPGIGTSNSESKLAHAPASAPLKRSKTGLERRPMKPDDLSGTEQRAPSIAPALPSLVTTTPTCDAFTGPPVCFRAGTFDVYLLLDNREVRGQSDRSFLQTQFERKNVKILTRALELGDFIWVAKQKHKNPGDCQEIVLDFIVERKIMDDLTASLKDGRYKEQKFRLSSTGAQIIYLVEESNFPDPAMKDAVETVITQTQAVQGFFVKRTATIDETVEYLTLLTRQLAAKYEKEDLFAIPTNNIHIETFKELRSQLEERDKRRYLLPFDAYQVINRKTRNFTLKDVWTRQLMTIKGMGGEKAAVIAAKYPTMKSLLEALDNSGDDKEKEGLLRALGGQGRKAINPALAKKLSDVLSLNRYP
ncbi:Crossover junction endonuclease mus81 [Borealophlyctis nickersoniae]|nr:Crossover junction endonuclease mus81 [Borealophlyctis nickersoniae]